MTIRRTPHDFVVDERLTPQALAALRDAADPSRTVALYRLTKTSLSTPEACAMLARSLRVKPGEAHPAGLKDKHAHTHQHVSIVTRSPADAGKLPPHTADRAWSAQRLGYLPEPLTSAAIEHNLFQIVVRDLSRQASDEINRRADALLDPYTAIAPALLFLNYFGDQRFGSARHGEGFLAPHLIRSEFEHALRLAIATPARKDTGSKRAFTRAAAARWPDFSAMLPELPRCPERRAIEHLSNNPGDFLGAFATLPMFFQQMSVEAYQSHLWNRTAHALAERIAQSCPSLTPPPTPDRPRSKPVQPLLRTPDPFGELAFPIAPAVSEPWRSLSLPILGKDSALHEPWATAAADVLSAEGITTANLRIPGLRRPFFGEAPRPLFVHAQEILISDPEPDELTAGKRLKRTLSFCLPRGCYATVLLRALGQ